MIPILILAAGQSTRMRGRDKLLEDVGGVPLLRLQVERALRLGGAVYVALGPDQIDRAAALGDLDVIALTVPEASEGMSGTMRSAIGQLPECPAFMMLLGDLVAIEADDLRKVYQAYLRKPHYLIWRGATDDNKPGHPIIFSSAIRPEFAKLSGDGGGEALVKPLIKQTWLEPLDGNRARLDLDTPEDWAAWRHQTSR